MAVRGIQTGPAAIHFEANVTSISLDICVKEKDPFSIVHLWFYSATIFTNLLTVWICYRKDLIAGTFSYLNPQYKHSIHASFNPVHGPQ